MTNSQSTTQLLREGSFVLPVLKFTPMISAAWVNSVVKVGWSVFLNSNGRSKLARSTAKTRWSPDSSMLSLIIDTKNRGVRPKVIHKTVCFSN